MRKLNKVMALSLAILMGASLVACGKSGSSTEEKTEATETAETTEAEKTEEAEPEKEAETEEVPDEETAKAEADLSSDGKVLNIQCWDDEFARRLTAYYPGYQANDPNDITAGGMIGDIEVKFVVTPTENNAYQNNLDVTLPGNSEVSENDKVDIFLVEADYAPKYVNTELCEPVSDLGIKEAELLGQYKYTNDIATDVNGNLKGLTWQGCPGVLVYNREAAKEILGSDDPETVQAAVDDWDTYNETAKKVAEYGYKMTATAFDTFRVFSDNISTPWVVDGTIEVDESIKEWVDMSKEQIDANATGTGKLLGDEWKAGLYPEGKVFCYFGPARMIDSYMAADDEASIAAQGGWGATTGPQGFSWGGTWICAAAGTDNPALVADIMRKLTVNTDIMTQIVKQDKDFVNNKSVMQAMAKDKNYGDAVLGGQNALDMFCEEADKLDRTNVSAYDQGCMEEFQNAMKDYFEGKKATYEEALETFYKRVTQKYPELIY